MQNTITIIANGTINNIDFHKDILKSADNIICADGGANHAKMLEVIPDYVIGDMDSVDAKTLKQLRDNGKTKVIVDPDQDKTDLELALELAQTLNATEIIILGAIGDSMDHVLANIFSLAKIPNAFIIDDKNKMTLVTDSIEIKGQKDDIVSVVPLTEVKGLTYHGLKWNVVNLNTNFGWLGVRNKMTGTKASISLKSGKILVIQPT